MTTPWFDSGWPGWHYQQTLDTAYVDADRIGPGDWQWNVRGHVPCPLCGAPIGALCATPTGAPTALVHTDRFRLTLTGDAPND